MSVIWTLSFVITLIILTIVVAAGANQLHIGDPDPEYNCSYCQPEQIHISFGEKINDIVVTWTTVEDSLESRVQFGTFHGAFSEEAKGNRTSYQVLRGQWIHRVTLRDLSFNTTYKYRCGSRFAWSELFSFTTQPEGESVLRVAIYGDMGVENAHALPYLQQEAENKSVDFILHVGDFAYDMNDNNAHVGDQFMRQIQPIAAITPYMVCSGNHEFANNFTHYKSRMTMPNHQQWESMFYSWDIGPIHFVSINTEAYNFISRLISFNDGPLVTQFNWLIKDLETANLKENREKRPWIIMYGHRPMYCSSSQLDTSLCFMEPTRTGVWQNVWQIFTGGKYELQYTLSQDQLAAKKGVRISQSNLRGVRSVQETTATLVSMLITIRISTLNR
ncbi:acid phosphatase type 7-like isoform X2 [Hyposmocoma kahamanoa]|uniref:acid phosphatase type 7-like isoform X2 n=1 Tax=Hyposmocoma kahamanoa TaxID=1477025 RepID=UPI000E6D91EA|nr:acid phosphatase type 7-like isoform X2 [Hyposmocoma kahamanoa]